MVVALRTSAPRGHLLRESPAGVEDISCHVVMGHMARAWGGLWELRVAEFMLNLWKQRLISVIMTLKTIRQCRYIWNSGSGVPISSNAYLLFQKVPLLKLVKIPKNLNLHCITGSLHVSGKNLSYLCESILDFFMGWVCVKVKFSVLTSFPFLLPRKQVLFTI